MKLADLVKNKSVIWSTVGVLVLIVGIFVTLQLIPEEQDIRQEAATETGTTQIKISPTSMALKTNETKKATVQINTLNTPIRGVSAVLSYPFVGNAPLATSENLQISAPFNAAPWTCSVKRISPSGQQILIEVACAADASEDTGLPNGYSTANQFVDLFTFDVKAGSATTTTPITITFNNQETIMTTVTRTTADQNQDIAAIPTTRLQVTITEDDTQPPANEKKVTVTAPTLSCSADNFSVSATVTEGTTKKENVTVTFKYNNETKTAVTNNQGIATITFAKASTTQNVTAEAADYTSGSAAATIPTGCDDTSNNPKVLTLSLADLGCGKSTFTATVTAKDGSSNSNGLNVRFKFESQEKTATTGSDGKATVTFDRASGNRDVTVEADGYVTDTETAELPTNCSSSSNDDSSSTTAATCNQSCSASRSCASGLSCINGFCRDSRCSSDTSCGCEDVDLAAQNGTTELPESGFDQTAAMMGLGLIFLLGGAQLLWSYKAHQSENNQE